MGDNLHELNRKELKELCSRNNIRTAGVKHEDLVRLLRSKLYPSTPYTPRSTRARGSKVLSPGKEDVNPYKTPGKPSPETGRKLRSSTLPREDTAATPRRNLGSSRKPLLAKSNTVSSRRTNLPTKTPGVEQDATQENFVRRLCQINGLSPLSRKGQLDTPSKTSRLSVVNSDGNTEDMTSPRTSEGNVEPSEAGSDGSRRISEIATDAGPDTLSDFSDADEFRSVSSEPISKLSSVSKRSPLRTQEANKMSQSRLSSFTAGTWDTSDHSRGMDSLVVDGNNSENTNVAEVIFPEFPEGSSFLVGDSESLDLSFLHAGAADPEVISNGSDHEGIQVNGKNHAVKELDVMDSPMARDYVNYTRGSDTDIKENCMNPNRVSISELTSDLGENPGDLNVENSSIDVAENQRDSAAIIPAGDADPKEVGHINDLAPGNEETESEQSCSGIKNSDHGEPIAEDVDDGPEIHSELPCFESHSPPFDSKDYSVAKKLVFEPEDSITPSVSLRQPKYDDAGGEEVSNFQNGEGEPVLSVPETFEVFDDSSLHTKSVTSLDEPESQHGGLAETVSETLPPAIENISSDVDGGEQDVSSSTDRDGGIASVEEFDAPAKQNDAGIRHQQESELADSRVPSEGVDSFEAEDPDTSSLDRHVSQPEMDMSSVASANVTLSDSSLTNKSSGNVTPEDPDTSSLDRLVSQPEMDMSSVASANVTLSDSSLTNKSSGNVTPEDPDTSSLDRLVSQPEMDMSSVASANVTLSDSSLTNKSSGNVTPEDPDTSSLDRHVSQPEMDVSSVASANVVLPDSSLTSKSSGNVTPDKLDRSHSLANEQEGSDVKARDAESASTSTTVPDYKKEEGEKEKISFPLSIILWCSQSCSLVSRNRTPRLGS